MPPTIAIIAPGAMGSAVGHRLTARGARVLTVTRGRSEQSAVRARAAGMIPVALPDIATADFVFSIVPPAAALGLATELAAVLSRAPTKPVYVDFNAINPGTMAHVVTALAASGCEVLDGAIIGAPPIPGGDGPTFYLSGDPQHRASVLSELGLKVRAIDGPVGAASSLKMVYAGINKGLTALGTAMLLAAARSDCAQGLLGEMTESLPQVLARLRRNIPDMYPKAHRWVAEMNEIASFLGPSDPAAGMFEAAAGIFARIAQDREADGELAATLNVALGLDPTRGRPGT